jgi:hypothetical protein
MLNLHASFWIYFCDTNYYPHIIPTGAGNETGEDKLNVLDAPKLHLNKKKL